MFELFTFLSVFVSIILGLAIAHTLGGISRLIQFRDRLEIYWVQLVWVFTIFLLQVLFWWGTWIYQSVENWTFLLFILFLLTPISLWILSDLILPELGGDSEVSLETYFFRTRGWFFAMLALFLVLTGLNLVMLGDGQEGNLYRLAFRAIGILLLVLASISRSHRLHATVAVVVLVLVTGYALLFMPDSIALGQAPAATAQN